MVISFMSIHFQKFCLIISRVHAILVKESETEVSFFFSILSLLLSGATDWCVRWKKNGWKTVNGTEVKNKTEFQRLTKLCDEIDVKWVSFTVRNQ